MAIFMPIDNSLQHLSFNNFLRLQTPTQNFKNCVITKEKVISTESNILRKYSNDFMSMMSEEKHNLTAIKLNILNDADESCDSELSVGQEKLEDDKSETNFDAIESEVLDNHMEDEEDNSSNASMSSSFLLSTNQQSTNAIHLSTILRPNASRLHEEIIRNSQLYAEELVRQQLAAAACLQNISGSKVLTNSLEIQRKISNSTPEESDPKMGFSATINPTKSIENNRLQNGNNIFCNNKSAINFQNIHSHLSAISQITNSLTSSNNINVKKDDNTSLSSLSRESSQSPNIMFHTQQNHMHDRNLKFSIDNILKADFGRRITEPLLRTAKSKKSLREEKQERDHFNKFNAPASTKDSYGSSTDVLVPESSPSSNQLPQSKESSKSETSKGSSSSGGTVWPAWVFCTRYSDRPSSGPRVKKPKKPPSDKSEDEKRPRTAFSGPQLARLKHEFNENRYLTEKRRQQLSGELGLNEAQIKIWFQNKRAKIKKSTGQKNPLALQLMAQGLYNHSTVPLSKEEEEMHQLQELEGR